MTWGQAGRDPGHVLAEPLLPKGCTRPPAALGAPPPAPPGSSGPDIRWGTAPWQALVFLVFAISLIFKAQPLPEVSTPHRPSALKGLLICWPLVC